MLAEAKAPWMDDLARRGLSEVKRLLDDPDISGTTPSAEIRLHVSGLENPSRKEVVEWLEFHEAGERARKRRLGILKRVATALILVIAVSAWPVVKRLIGW